MKTKRIGLVLSKVPGYSETFFRYKIKGLQSDGYEVVLFVDYFDTTNTEFPCKIVKAPDFNGGKIKTFFIIAITFLKALFFTPKRSLRLFTIDKTDGIPLVTRLKHLILNQFLLTEDLDWLHFGFGMLAHGRENVAMAIGAQMAVSFRGYDLYLSPLKHPGCYDLLFTKSVRYHVLSEGMKHTLLGYHIPDGSIDVIPPAIDTDFFQSSHTSKDSPVLNLVTIARLHWKKGLEYTLEALSNLKNKGISFTYTIVGDGDQRERLIFAAYQLGILEDIRFVGRLSPDDVKKELDRSTLYLQYSIQEGFCNAVLEAQSMGLLCLVSNAEGLEENVLDGITGWVIPKRQPALLASQIEAVLQLSDQERQYIRSKAIARVKGSFDLKRQRELFCSFYEI